MDEKMTMEITNDRLEEAIREYAADRTKERLTEILNLLRPTKLLVPAMLKGPNQPIPCFLKNNHGEQFLVVYTSKAQIPEEPKSQAILNMTFPACNNVVAKLGEELMGMVINPFTDNLILKRELIEKLHEADEKAAKTKQVKMTPAQFDVFVKKQVEYGILPKRLYAEGQEFVDKLCEEREVFINQIFAEAFKEPKLYPYSEKDYSVMALDIAEDLTLIRIDMPERGMVTPLCFRAYVTFNPKTKKAGYFTIEMTSEEGMHMLCGMDEKLNHIIYGQAPVEGAELQEIMNLARNGGNGLTS